MMGYAHFEQMYRDAIEVAQTAVPVYLILKQPPREGGLPVESRSPWCEEPNHVIMRAARRIAQLHTEAFDDEIRELVASGQTALRLPMMLQQDPNLTPYASTCAAIAASIHPCMYQTHEDKYLDMGENSVPADAVERLLAAREVL